MPRVALGEPPTIAGRPKYHDYKGWLLAHFYDHHCSYCLTRNDAVQVDHYEPQKHAPGRIDDPTNLLLSCPICNGASCKSDYHPDHAERRRLKSDSSGHLVLDVRADDVAEMFALDEKGGIDARDGDHKDRAQWNIVLLKLDLTPRNEGRREAIDLLQACERLVARAVAETGSQRADTDGILSRLLPHVRRCRTFYRVFGITLSPDLSARLAALSS